MGFEALVSNVLWGQQKKGCYKQILYSTTEAGLWAQTQNDGMAP